MIDYTLENGLQLIRLRLLMMEQLNLLIEINPIIDLGF